MASPKHNLLGLTQDELAVFAESIGERKYRGRQMFSWLYTKGATTVGEMTDLGKAVRQRLERTATIQGLTLLGQQQSAHDHTTKFLFGLPDGLNIESVLIPPASAFSDGEAVREDEQRRLTLCLSTQVGCPLDCKFCATGTMGFLRNLTTGEIIDQILQARRITRKRVTNLVFMGMGEPMMNYNNVMRSVGIIAHGIGIAVKRITVSTAGWVPGIRQMGDERQRTKLAISLHSAVDETRTKLMPINKKYNLQSLLSAVEYYHARTKHRVTYEFIFFDGVNDTVREVDQLIKLAHRAPCKINVIPYHSIEFAGPRGLAASLRPSPRTAVIVEKLRSSNLTVMIRSSAGEDIDAACGQLVVKGQRRKRKGSADLPGVLPSYERAGVTPV